MSKPTYYIENWDELAELPESDTHRLEISTENCNGWIIDKRNPNAHGHYLSTHTFYGENHECSTELLRQCGFNVTLANWDAPTTKQEEKR
jgi:hypothetical protein